MTFALVGLAAALGWNLTVVAQRAVNNIIRTAADAQAAHGYHD